MNEEARKQVEMFVDGIIKRSIAEFLRSSADIHDEDMSPDTESDEVSELDAELDELESNVFDLTEPVPALDTFAEKMANASLAEGICEAANMKRILCVGIVCLDVITECDEFPREDTETLASGLRWARGGNASNTATVLAHLGAKVEYLGTMIRNEWLEFLTADFAKNDIGYEHCVFLDKTSHKFPVATIINSKLTGSRTSLADFRDVTELTFDQFSSADLTKYDWIHFEGRPRNPDIARMIDKVIEHNSTITGESKITVSVEIEQPHSTCPELLPLFLKADLVFVSKDYAQDLGFKTKEEAVEKLYNRCKPEATIVCPWSEHGAAARWRDGSYACPALAPGAIMDTLGAGDTFNAAVIYALHRGKSVQAAVAFACKVAGYKCGVRGFDGIKGLQRFLL